MSTIGTILPWLGLFTPIAVSIAILLVVHWRQSDDPTIHERHFRH